MWLLMTGGPKIKTSMSGALELLYEVYVVQKSNRIYASAAKLCMRDHGRDASPRGDSLYIPREFIYKKTHRRE